MRALIKAPLPPRGPQPCMHRYAPVRSRDPHDDEVVAVVESKGPPRGAQGGAEEDEEEREGATGVVVRRRVLHAVPLGSIFVWVIEVIPAHTPMLSSQAQRA